MKGFRSGLLRSAAFVTAVGVAMPAHAQVQEIVVTAQKREQSAKDVPISLQVVSGADIQKQQITTVADLTDSLPNVFVTQDSVANNIFIRGVGSGENAGFEQAVPTFVDGVFHGRSRYTQSTLVDVDRIEVLRGPQTIYFGNNAIGGAFSVTTKAPSLTEWGGYAQASYELEGKEPAIQGAVGGPVVPDRLAVRVAGSLSHLGGYIHNDGTGANNPKTDSGFARVSSLLKLNDDWNASFKFEYGKETNNAPFPVQLTHCPPEAPFSAATTFSCAYALATGQEANFDYNRASSAGERGRMVTYEYVAKLERDNSDGIGVVAQAALSRYNFLLAADTDGTPADFFSYSQTEHQNQKTLELRFSSPKASKLQYIFGAYYLDARLGVNTTLNFPFATVLLTGQLAPLAPYAPLAGPVSLSQHEKAWSVFGSVTYPLTDQLSITAGLRYTKSSKSGVQSATNATASDPYGFQTTPLPAALQPVAAYLTGFVDHTNNARVKDDAFLPSVSLQYKPTKDVSLYVKYSKGFKAGGFDAVELTGVPSNLTYRPERVNAYEAGLKSYLFDHKVSFDLAVFLSNYKDLQQSVPQYTATAAYISVFNVGALRTKGIEASLTWQPDRSFEFGADLSVLDAKYRNYTNAGCTALQAYNASLANVPCTQDLSGRTPPFAPSLSGNVRATYTVPVGGALDFSFGGMVSFSGPYNVLVSQDPNTRQGAWQKIDARIALDDRDGRWGLAFVGKNLANTKVLSSATETVASSGSYSMLIERGRTLALQAHYRF